MTSDHLSLSYSSSLPLPAVAELSEEEESYAALHDQLDQLHLWLSRLTTLLFNSPLSDDIPRDCRRIDAWCRAAVRRQSDPQRSVLEAPYLALIQSEIAELFAVIEGAEAAPKPLKQLHRMQTTVRHALQHTHTSSLREWEENRGEENRGKEDNSWDVLYAAFRGEFVGETGKCEVGTRNRGNGGNGDGGRSVGGFVAGILRGGDGEKAGDFGQSGEREGRNRGESGGMWGMERRTMCSAEIAERTGCAVGEVRFGF